MDGEDDQIVARGVEIADAGFQVAACVEIELPRRFELGAARGLNNEEFSAQLAYILLNPPQEFLADSLTLELLPRPNPVQIEGCLGQRTAAVSGEAEDFLAPARHQEMIPTLLPLGREFGPQLFDGCEVISLERGDAAR